MDNESTKSTGMREVMLVAGLVLVGAGCWVVYPPLAGIVPGAVLTLIAVFGIR